MLDQRFYAVDNETIREDVLDHTHIIIDSPRFRRELFSLVSVSELDFKRGLT